MHPSIGYLGITFISAIVTTVIFIAYMHAQIEQFSSGGGKDIVKLLVGNKIDLGRDVDRAVAEDWARSRGMLFIEVRDNEG